MTVSSSSPFDIAIIGGGINGAGIARDAAGQGLKVLLCEKGDLGNATSSASSKLIHGGLRYLEYGEFKLVRAALKERETLLRIAPHLVRPMRFVLPHQKKLRPSWIIRIGLFLYDHLARRGTLPGSRGLNLLNSPEGGPLKDDYKKGFIYSDCWVDDARLVVVNCLDAAEHGADIRTRTTCSKAECIDSFWRLTLKNEHNNKVETVLARSLINAAGPWVDQILKDVLSREKASRLKLVQGSHIVVDRLYDGEQAYILQNEDRRIVFSIPYEKHFTMVGTTEAPFEGDPTDPEISGKETRYLCEVINRHFNRQISPPDVRWSFAGVRPLYDDGKVNASAVTRDYVFDLDVSEDAPLLSIYGGKLTTYRSLAEHALAKLLPEIGHEPKPWTAARPLPGGDMPEADFDRFLEMFRNRHPFLDEKLSERLARAYGTRADRVIGDATSLEELGADLGGGVCEKEALYLKSQEWAETDEDIFWRRTKAGLFNLL